MDEISAIVEPIVRKRFENVAGVAIHAVTVAPDTDFDGNDVFRVNIVFENKGGPLDPLETATMVGRIRDALLARKDDTFPIVAFISKKDAKGLGAAAA